MIQILTLVLFKSSSVCKVVFLWNYLLLHVILGVWSTSYFTMMTGWSGFYKLFLSCPEFISHISLFICNHSVDVIPHWSACSLHIYSTTYIYSPHTPPPSILVLQIWLKCVWKYCFCHIVCCIWTVLEVWCTTKLPQKKVDTGFFFVLSHLRKQLLSSYLIQEMCYGVFHLFLVFLIY